METIAGGGLTGVKAGRMIRDTLEVQLGVRRAPPIICPNGCGPMRIVSYVLYRPDQAECDACGAEWGDARERPGACLKCGWEPAEGQGCLAHGTGDPAPE